MSDDPSIWEVLNEPVMPRWFLLLLLLWFASGKPEIPVRRLVKRIAGRFRRDLPVPTHQEDK